MTDKRRTALPLFPLWVACLTAVSLAGSAAYAYQLANGLSVTGLSRDVSWGAYIAQFTFLVGVAASSVVLLIPALFHNVRPFANLLVFGEGLTVSAICMGLLFILVDLGQPQRLLNILLYPSPSSLMFWDMLTLAAYLALTVLAARTGLAARKNGVEPPALLGALLRVSVILAFSIHIVTALLYAGLPGRPYWLTAILAARFLASAFCSGPALLLLLLLAGKRFTGFAPGKEAVRPLAALITYAMAANVLFFLLEAFTALYSGIPDQAAAFAHLFTGGADGNRMPALMWTSALLSMAALALLVPPRLRNNKRVLPAALIMLVIAVWIEKGPGLIAGGFSPNAFGSPVEYTPSVTELAVSAGIYAAGLLLLSFLWRNAARTLGRSAPDGMELQ